MISYTHHTNAQVKIDPLFFGSNYWFTSFNQSGKQYRPDLNSAAFPNIWKEVINSGVKSMRVGGRGYNTGPQKPSAISQYLTIVDAIRGQGCEPLITIPFSGVKANILMEAQNAAEIIRLLNVEHKQNVKYFIIANEPGIDYGFDIIHEAEYAQSIADYIKPFAIAMKKADPDIKIIGPEMESFQLLVMSYLLSDPANPYSISGLIPGSKLYYIDVFSFHGYPPHEQLNSRKKIYKYPYQTFDKRIKQIYRLFPIAKRTDTNLAIAFTEFNIMHGANHAPNNDALTISDINGNVPRAYKLNTPNSFIAGQWMTEMLCIGLMNHLKFMNLWSVKESGNRKGSNHDYLGYLHGTSGEKKPTYHHYKLLAGYFNGLFFSNFNNGKAAYMSKGIKAFASQNTTQIAVLLLNETRSSKNFKINFNSITPSGSEEKIRFNIFSKDSGVPEFDSSAQHISLEAETTMMLLFDLAGKLTDSFLLSRKNMVNALKNNTYQSYPDNDINYHKKYSH